MAEYAGFIRNFAEKVGAPVCDMHAYISYTAQLEQIINPDRIHPNSLGQYHMAKYFLEYQGETIGEYAPIPSYLDEWRSAVAKLRSIRATEHMIICNYSLSIPERIQKAKDYIASGGSGVHKEYFLLLSNKYLEYKPIQDALEEQANRLMDSLYN